MAIFAVDGVFGGLDTGFRESVGSWYVYVVEPSEPRIVRDHISRAELRGMAAARFGDMVKAVVDIGRGIGAFGGELHSDEEALLLEDGSRQSDLWGINLYPDESGEDWLEFDSMINVRPSQNNRSRSVDDESLRNAIRRVVAALVEAGN